MDAQDPNMFGMSSVASSVMELLCCVPSETVCKLYEKHVFTLIITFSAAVMDAKGKNMFWPLLSYVPSAGVIMDDQHETSSETLLS